MEKWHGTLGGYTNHDCRCAQCMVAMRAHYKKKRDQERARRDTCLHLKWNINGIRGGRVREKCAKCTVTRWRKAA